MDPPESSGHEVASSSSPSQPVSGSRALSHATDAAPAICRICRGEGTATEPLFYPCKCSGSIKYVHQDCLMEWLSHSQKKYCELCKMSFRFTKLYAPDMPKSLPAHIFLEHMARYTVRNLLAWLRIVVALSVWACWLPYFMRCVWSFMFWLSDGGVGASATTAHANGTSGNTLQSLASTSQFGVCPASPLLATDTTSAAEAAAILGGLSGGEISEYLVRFLFGSFSMPVRFGRSDTGLQSNASFASVVAGTNQSVPETPSLLGGVAFLRQLTRSQTLNRIVVAVLEGQVITILVIVSFILVILVRDYVVQQQPELNLRAAFDAAEHQLHQHAMNEPELAELDQLPLPHAPEPDSDDETLDDDAEPSGPANAGQSGVIEAAWAQQEALMREMQFNQNLLYAESRGYETSNRAGIEPMASSSSSDESYLDEYLQLYRRAEGDPEKMLEIVQEEGLENKLHYWVDVQQRSVTAKDDIGRKFADLLTSRSAAALSSRNLVEHSGSPNSPQLDAAALGLTALSTPDRSPNLEPRGKDIQVWPPGSQIPSGQPRQRSSSHGPRLEALPSLPDDFHLGSDSLLTDYANNHSSATDELMHDQDENEAAPQNQVPMEEMLPVDQNQEHGADEPAPNPVPMDEAPVNRQQAGGFAGHIANFMWGNLEEHQNAVHNTADNNQDVDEEDLWVDVPMGEDMEAEDVDAENAGLVARNAEVIEEMDDLEDFDGAMELIGVRGPLIGLFQNAIFCAVLVSVTVFGCVFVPYNLGRITLVFAADPLQLLSALLELSKIAQDMGIMTGTLVSWCLLNLVDIVTSILGGALAAKVVMARRASWVLWTGAGNRIWDFARVSLPMSASDLQSFSVISHQALVLVKSTLASGLGRLYHNFTCLPSSDFHIADGKLPGIMVGSAISMATSIRTAVTLLLDPGSWVIDLSSHKMDLRSDLDAGVAWSNIDRFWAILAGYLTISTVGALYLRRGTPFSRNNLLHAWEAGIIDTLQQASGIIKVILVISIEMLVFPLYCGILLDVALLPIFENATLKSRIVFTYNFPLTSAFVHWFAGTGYMFHFALFVAMCRKIVRPGVLYFIRDPDDPEFHPVRDVLEKSLAAQLRKIMFSALIYGTLVTVGLGGVVWTLSYGVPGILPIHYSSNDPVLEFPVDLLFYNFLMPLAIRILKPADQLHATYTWWFRTCARCLRLTHFLFGERKIDEEGTLQLPSSPKKWQSAYTLLKVNEDNKVVPMTWRDIWQDDSGAKPDSVPSAGGETALRRKKKSLVKTKQLVKSGRFVRAPGSDRVRIPKGRNVFLPVAEGAELKRDRPENDLYVGDQFKTVYVPPNFRSRIFFLIMSIWLFAGITGISIAVIPLAFGRMFFKTLIPSYIRTNDIYAFSIGIYILGTFVFCALRIQRIILAVRTRAQELWDKAVAGSILRRVASGLAGTTKLAYTYIFVVVVLPLVLSLTMELYIAIPLDTYMNPPGSRTVDETLVQSSAYQPHTPPDAASHSILIIQSWTLGVLYLNLVCRMILSLAPEDRMSIALRSMMRHGMLRPDVEILTRAFVVPATVLVLAAAFGPPLAVKTMLTLGSMAGFEVCRNSAVLLYRYSYPAGALLCLLVQCIMGLGGIFRGWKTRIRDEAYQIGERLHNFGTATAGSRMAKRAWGAGRARV